MRMRRISPETTYGRNKASILAQFGDYGHGLSPEDAFVDQIDRMMVAGETPYNAIYRFMQGGGVLVYNDDVRAYMEGKLGIPCADDPDFFERYCRLMAMDGLRLYNEVKARPKAPVRSKAKRTTAKGAKKAPAGKTAKVGTKRKVV